jgi:hypothetical protein
MAACVLAWLTAQAPWPAGSATEPKPESAPASATARVAA